MHEMCGRGGGALVFLPFWSEEVKEGVRPPEKKGRRGRKQRQVSQVVPSGTQLFDLRFFKEQLRVEV